ncbi:MAG: 2-hydroxychromene-2-carboxylate isomerase [Rhodospirillaceae bacterium]|nr:2-hydroxychromene-2-carboxylate isomerase [Rhodospirillaceae bacterium]
MKEVVLDLEFWFSIGSTYTSLTVMRMDEIEARHKINFRLMPFSVRKVMLDMDNVPFPPNKESKVAYMWRDIERRAASYGFPVRVPAPYPLQEFDRANKIALLGVREGWIKDYVLHTYKNWFQNGMEAGSDENLEATFKILSMDIQDILVRSQTSEIEKTYAHQTSLAVEKGIFGSPTFIVGKEVFWGDDRLEDAISWLKNQKKVNT